MKKDKSICENKCVDILKEVYPNASVIEKTADFILMQKDKTGEEFFVLPREYMETCETFKKSAHRFLTFMRALGGLCRQLNNHQNNWNGQEKKGDYYANVALPEKEVGGYVAHIYFLPKKISTQSQDLFRWSNTQRTINGYYRREVLQNG